MSPINSTQFIGKELICCIALSAKSNIGKQIDFITYVNIKCTSAVINAMLYIFNLFTI